MNEDARSGSPGEDPSSGIVPTSFSKHAPSIPLSRSPLKTTKEASAYLGYRSERRLQNLRAARMGPEAIKLPSGGVRYRVEDLEAWAVAVTSAGEPNLRGLARSSTQQAKQSQRRERDLERQRARRANERRGERK